MADTIVRIYAKLQWDSEAQFGQTPRIYEVRQHISQSLSKTMFFMYALNNLDLLADSTIVMDMLRAASSTQNLQAYESWMMIDASMIRIGLRTWNPGSGFFTPEEIKRITPPRKEEL